MGESFEGGEMEREERRWVRGRERGIKGGGELWRERRRREG